MLAQAASLFKEQSNCEVGEQDEAELFGCSTLLINHLFMHLATPDRHVAGF
jgi:hypothetical protein